ncbi:MAG: glycosyltransferase family 39 protein [Ignavibacteriae bacterium]|nr:glycosyltransferase family 39 protein [Ignavibacteriota bacterium]
MDDDRLSRMEVAVMAAGAVLILFLSSIGITRFPLPWWDEGWTLSVAKNWVATGHYGHILNGLPAGPSLSAHLPVVAIVSASFIAFGVGLAQARMAMITCAVITLVLFYVLSRRVFGRSAALVAVVLVSIVPVQWDLSILVLGRNVLGEVPSLMFILTGSYLFLESRGNRPLLLVASGIVFGLALATKAQVVPFVLFGLGSTSAVLLVRQRRRGLHAGMVIGLAVLVMYLIGLIRSMLLVTPGVPSDPVVGLTEVTAMVLDPAIRGSMLRFAFFTGAPLTLALGVALTGIVSSLRAGKEMSWNEVVRMMLALLAGSWYLWFITLSIGWGRYGFPAFFLIAPFSAELILRLVRAVRGTLSGIATPRIRWGAGGLLIFFCLMAGRQGSVGVQALVQGVPASGLEETAAFINHATPPGASVETYESELLFLLDRPVHVPPAQLNVDVIRRNWLGGSDTRTYDPLTVNAEYLIIGAFGTGLYDPLIREGRYVPARRFGTYAIFRRATERR